MDIYFDPQKLPDYQTEWEKMQWNMAPERLKIKIQIDLREKELLLPSWISFGLFVLSERHADISHYNQEYTQMMDNVYWDHLEKVIKMLTTKSNRQKKIDNKRYRLQVIDAIKSFSKWCHVYHQKKLHEQELTIEELRSKYE